MGATAHGLTEWEADLDKAIEELTPAAERVVGQGCNNIKKQSRSIIEARSVRGYLPHYPRSIGYDVTTAEGTITGTVGPDKAMLQGGLGRLIENGSVNNAPIPHLRPSADAEQENFAYYTAKMGEQLLKGLGLDAADGPVVDPG